MISVGIVFVLLLGEIDLSVGSVSGVRAAIFAVLDVKHGVNPVAGADRGIGGGAGVGSLHGFFFAKIGVPAFVVTLAGMLAWNGVCRATWSAARQPGRSRTACRQLTTTSSSQVAAAYGLAAVGVAGYLAAALLGANRRREAGLPFRPGREIALRTGLLAVVAFGAAYVAQPGPAACRWPWWCCSVW